MKRSVKIHFSANELQLLGDVSFLSAKRQLTEKLYELMSALSEKMKASELHQYFSYPEGVDFQRGKISKGENLDGLPYVLLDFPRLFNHENVFAFRTLFWWGNYFSFTLHLKGEPLDKYRKPILMNFEKLKNKGIKVYTGNDEWQHDWRDEKYVLLEKADKNIFLNHGFIKLSASLPLSKHEKFLKEGVKNYERFLKLLTLK